MPQEASICHGLSCSVENLEISSDFVKQGAIVNKNVYTDDILVSALSDMNEHFKNDDFTFQQDGTPSHTSNKTQAWCRNNFPQFWSKELWPPSYHTQLWTLWKYLWLKLGPKYHRTILRAAVKNFRGRIERVIAPVRWHIENKLFYCFVRLWNNIWSMQL